MNSAIVLNINFGARLCLNALDVLASRTNKLPDALRINLNGLDSRGMLAKLSNFGNRRCHGLLHLGASFLRHVDGILENIKGDATQLQVELETGDSFTSSTQLPIHVTVEILTANNIHKQLVILEVALVVKIRDKPNGDPAYRTLQRHTCLKKGHRSRAHRSHGR